MQAAGVPAGAVQHTGDIIDGDPQMAVRGFYQRFADGSVVEGVPFQLSETPQNIDPRLHDLGEDTTYVLSDILGMDGSAVARLFEIGAVGGT